MWRVIRRKQPGMQGQTDHPNWTLPQAWAKEGGMDEKPASDVAKAEKAMRQSVKEARRKAALKANMARRKAVVRARAANEAAEGPAAENNSD